MIAASGTRAVTHRAVAKEAGVPLAATTYYFASKEDLLAEAFRYLADAEIAEIDKGIKEIPETMSPQIAAFIAASFTASDLRNKRAKILAELELHLEASRRPELLDIHRLLSDAALQFCVVFVKRAGSTSPEADGGLFLSILTGLQLGEVADPTPRFETEVAQPLMYRFFEAMCTSAE